MQEKYPPTMPRQKRFTTFNICPLMAFTLLDWRADNVVESKGSKKKLCHLAAERLKVKKDRSAGKRISPLQYNIVSIFGGKTSC